MFVLNRFVFFLQVLAAIVDKAMSAQAAAAAAKAARDMVRRKSLLTSTVLPVSYVFTRARKAFIVVHPELCWTTGLCLRFH